MKITIPAMVEGGKASAGPPLGPALGPTGVNIQEVINKINEKTKNYAGLKVPVKVIVDKDKKTFEIEVGSPPSAELLKSEAGVTKGKTGQEDKAVADLKFEQIIKVAKMNSEKSLAKNIKNQVKEVLGTCLSLGFTCDGKNPKQVIKEIDQGNYDSLLSGA